MSASAPRDLAELIPRLRHVHKHRVQQDLLPHVEVQDEQRHLKKHGERLSERNTLKYTYKPNKSNTKKKIF